jgi:hypothetical protein
MDQKDIAMGLFSRKEKNAVDIQRKTTPDGFALDGDSIPGILNFPFNKECVTAVRMHYTHNSFTNEWRARGTVEFKKGNTEGTQRIEEKSIGDFLRVAQEFISELE